MLLLIRRFHDLRICKNMFLLSFNVTLHYPRHVKHGPVPRAPLCDCTRYNHVLTHWSSINTFNLLCMLLWTFIRFLALTFDATNDLFVVFYKTRIKNLFKVILSPKLYLNWLIDYTRTPIVVSFYVLLFLKGNGSWSNTRNRFLLSDLFCV